MCWLYNSHEGCAGECKWAHDNNVTARLSNIQKLGYWFFKGHKSESPVNCVQGNFEKLCREEALELQGKIIEKQLSPKNCHGQNFQNITSKWNQRGLNTAAPPPPDGTFYSWTYICEMLNLKI